MYIAVPMGEDVCQPVTRCLESGLMVDDVNGESLFFATIGGRGDYTGPVRDLVPASMFQVTEVRERGISGQIVICPETAEYDLDEMWNWFIPGLPRIHIGGCVKARGKEYRIGYSCIVQSGPITGSAYLDSREPDHRNGWCIGANELPLNSSTATAATLAYACHKAAVAYVMEHSVTWSSVSQEMARYVALQRQYNRLTEAARQAAGAYTLMDRILASVPRI